MGAYGVKVCMEVGLDTRCSNCSRVWRSYPKRNGSTTSSISGIYLGRWYVYAG